MISQPSGNVQERSEKQRPERLGPVWLVAALLPLILLGGWLSQFA